MTDNNVTRAEVCAAAIADAFKDDGEIFGSPMGMLPTLGARLAKLTSNPDLVISDGESLLLAGTPPLFAKADVIEGWVPFRRVFELITYGKRHVMMGATQVDRHGNQNISAIGDFDRPKRQLLGVRGAPSNTVNNRTSYWVPKHSTRVFVEAVDTVSGVGPRNARQAGAAAAKYNDIHRIVTNLAVLDVSGPDDTVRLVSVHPGVSVTEVQAVTGFELAVTGEVPETRLPTDEELTLIRNVIDPKTLRDREVPPVQVSA
ncbi:MAG: CoA-transferase [Nocardioides sp.]|nr:CoA-transferase [Nocardioides sp.]